MPGNCWLEGKYQRAGAISHENTPAEDALALALEVKHARAPQSQGSDKISRGWSDESWALSAGSGNPAAPPRKQISSESHFATTRSSPMYWWVAPISRVYSSFSYSFIWDTTTFVFQVGPTRNHRRILLIEGRGSTQQHILAFEHMVCL